MQFYICLVISDTFGLDIYLFLFHFRHTIKMKNAIGNEVTVMFLWSREQEDGAKVVRVENLNNPYKDQPNFDRRFKLTLNKLYAWSLVDYDRVIMLDADNLFLQKTDELFQCGKFCAVFINPCIFHTGLFVLQVNPSSHF